MYDRVYPQFIRTMQVLLCIIGGGRYFQLFHTRKTDRRSLALGFCEFYVQTLPTPYLTNGIRSHCRTRVRQHIPLINVADKSDVMYDVDYNTDASRI